MSINHNDAHLCLVLSVTDLTMILTAISAYAHIASYRDLRERLQHQVANQRSAGLQRDI